MLEKKIQETASIGARDVLLFDHDLELLVLTTPYTMKVDIEDAGKLGFIRLMGSTAAPADAGIVHGNVKAAEASHSLGNAISDLSGVLDVEGQLEDLNSRELLAEVGDRGRESGGVDVGQGEVVDAVPGKGEGCIFTDA